MNFYIMNKDTPVLEFSCSYRDGVEQVYNQIIIKPDLVPLSIQNGLTLDEWLDSRLILSHRKHIYDMFKQSGLRSKEDIFKETKGISLNDTYWVRQVDSKLKWVSISPYRNQLNRGVSIYAFDEDKEIECSNITHSPDFATSGNYPKCWQRFGNRTYLVKGGTTLGINKGNEPFSEIFADDLLRVLGISHIHYEYIMYRGVDTTKCANMCNEDIGISPLSYIRPDIKNFVELLDTYNHCDYLLDMFLFDYLTLNTDRHFGNISFFIQNDTQQILGFTPIYDNNMAFLPYYIPRLDGDIDNYISISDGNIVANDGTSFEDLFKMIDCKRIREKLSLLRSYTVDFKYKRGDIVNRVLQRQLSLIPKNVV